jgi:hypothetical protein
MSIWDDLWSRLGGGEVDQGAPMAVQNRQGGFDPYRPEPAPDPMQLLRDMTGATDLGQAYQAYQRGEYLPALGQGAWGAAQAAGTAFPALKAGGAALRAGAPLAREAAAAIPGLLADTTGAIRAPKVAPVEPMFPQYAEQYPPVGPPTMKTGERGNIYPEKTLTPEAEAFAKERRLIQTDMNKRGYEPYFDPAQRFYVDPSQYPPANIDTATIVPKTKKSIEEYTAIIGAPETRAALQAAHARGVDLGNAEHWYAMAQLEKKYIDELGPQAGRAAFLDEFATPMAATTSGNNPTANFLMAHHLEYLRKRGDPMPEAGHELPYPVGGRRAGVNLRDYAGMRERGGYAGLGMSQPKMHDFDRSMIGDLTRPVIDEQMAEGMLAHAPAGFANKARSGPGYGPLSRIVQEEAAAQGVLPGNIQDVAWAGFKNEPGQPMISIINDAIERTHRLTGMPRDEIVRRGLVRKEIPMYGLLGAAGLGGAAGYEP